MEEIFNKEFKKVVILKCINETYGESIDSTTGISVNDIQFTKDQHYMFVYYGTKTYYTLSDIDRRCNGKPTYLTYEIIKENFEFVQ